MIKLTSTLLALLSTVSIITPAAARPRQSRAWDMVSHYSHELGRTSHYCPYGERTSMYTDTNTSILVPKIDVIAGRSTEVHYPLIEWTRGKGHTNDPCVRAVDQYDRRNLGSLRGGPLYIYENRGLPGYCLPHVNPGDIIPDLKPCLGVEAALRQADQKSSVWGRDGSEEAYRARIIREAHEKSRRNREVKQAREATGKLPR